MKSFWMERNIKENVKINVFVQLIMKCIFKKKLSIFDDKRCYINETESKPWNYHNLINSHSSIQNRIIL